ncbi:MAG: PASTA domain-containing protein [Ruminococcus sp.]|nr:PASTA domain-containing protein [Ruminococcus sp.]
MAKGVKQTFISRSNRLLAMLLVLGLGAAMCRLGYLQIFKADVLQQKAVDQQLSDTTISAQRGTIYDVNGKVLATSASVWRVVIAPVYLTTDEHRQLVADGLAEILDMESETIFEKAQQSSYYVEIKRQIESDVREEVLAFSQQLSDQYGINGNAVYLLDDYKRYYPYKNLASSVIGFTGSDDQGLDGVEYQYNDILTGTPGRLVTATNAHGTALPFQYSQNIEAVDGSSLVLTIDETIQSIVEKYMQQGIEEHKVINRGVCIIMDVDTGAVRAMASVGGYDLNDPFTLDAESQAQIDALPEDERAQAKSAALSKMWRNKAVMDTYYPGSVFKMFTAAMAVEEGLVDENSSFYCDGGYEVAGELMHCHQRLGHGTQNFRQSILNSCNPAFMQIGELVQQEKFWQYYQAFGFSEKTGIDLPGEADDIFFSTDGSMGPVELATASFGQNFAVTPIQVATAVCAIANGGYIVQPHVVAQILDSDGNVTSTTSTEVKRQVISTETADLLCDILEENSTSGSGKNSYVPGYRVAGKTGTSEKKPASEDGIEDYIASFCGFAPANDPEVVCLVFFDTPKGNAYYGSQVAAPVFAQIMSEVMPYLQVATDYTEDELAALDKTAGTYMGMTVSEATAAAEEDGYTVTVKGGGETVLDQEPAAGTTIPQGGNVVLYTDTESATLQVEVPDFTGYDIMNVNWLASNSELNISITGVTDNAMCVASSQSIAPGTMVSPGTVVKVTFTGSGVSD